MMIEFAHESEIKDLIQENYDYEYAKNVLLRCEKTGVSLVSEDPQGQIGGMILSLRVPDLWLPNIIRLKELAWWVKPQYRQGTMGARLYAAYCQGAEEMMRDKKITGYTMTKLHNSPDFDYTRRGFHFIEATYMIGE